MAINDMYVFHTERGYFGESEAFESRIHKPYASRALKAVDKFFARYDGHQSDVMHIVTDDRDYVLSKELLDGEWRLCWFYFYGAQHSRSETAPCNRSDVRRMVKAQYGKEELAW